MNGLGMRTRNSGTGNWYLVAGDGLNMIAVEVTRGQGKL